MAMAYNVVIMRTEHMSLRALQTSETCSWSISVGISLLLGVAEVKINVIRVHPHTCMYKFNDIQNLTMYNHEWKHFCLKYYTFYTYYK
jgi:hypothetical protein